MISTRLTSAIAAAALLSTASAQSSSSSIVSIPTPTASVAANAMSDIGCFDTAVPLEDHGSYQFQSPGNCQLICLGLNKNVLGLVDGTNCWCGDLIPPKKAQTDNSSCDTPCKGTNAYKCGGPSKYWISLTGLTQNRIDNFDPASASSSALSTKPPPQSSQGQTVVVTATDAPAQKKSSGPNKAGIAAGVVVGVVVLAAVIIGVVLFLRHKKRREVEEDYRRQAAANSFISGGKLHTSNSSMTDSRLDPEFMNRRQSNGSIADNEDYSRRILKVTNA
jgi:cell wall integrity and stress response component